MKKFSSICSILLIAFLFMTATAFSSPFPVNVANDYYYDDSLSNDIPTAYMATDVPNIYNAINKILETTYSTNAEVDHLFMDNDSLWLNFGGSATVIGYSAWFHNTLGVYTAGGSQEVLTDQHGFGFAPDVPASTASIGVSDGTVFGWYLEVNDPDAVNVNTYYSESDRNTDKYDHMMTFDLGGPLTFNNIYYKNPCLIAWEDKSWGEYVNTMDHIHSDYYSSNIWSLETLGDEDYNDLMFLVDATTTATPEPATVLLLGSGLLGLAGLGRKRKRAFKNS